MGQELPSVTVVVPCLNPAFLSEAVASLRAQTVSARIIVVDDGSPGAEATRIAVAAGVETIRNETPMGAAAARNAGIERADSEWILIFDADDVAVPTMVERLLATAQVANDDVGVVHCAARYTDAFGTDLGPVPYFRAAPRWMLAYSVFVGIATMFRRKAWASAGGFDPNSGTNADVDFWIGLAVAGWEFRFVDEELWRYRAHANSMLRTRPQEEGDADAAYTRAKYPDFFSPLRLLANPRRLAFRIWQPLQYRLHMRR